MKVSSAAKVERDRFRRVRDQIARKLFDALPEALVVIDEAARIIGFSTAARRLLGFSERQLLGKNVKILMPSPMREQHDGFVRRYVENGRSRALGSVRGVNARHKDGSEIAVSLYLTEIRLDGNRYILGLLHDNRESEEQRRRLNYLTAELAHASRVSSMGMLASAIAHELNQPLTAICNYAETAEALLQDAALPQAEVHAEALRSISREAHRAGEILGRFRNFMSNGELEKTRESLSVLLTEALSLALADGEHDHVAVEMGIDPNAETVLADAIEIEQVLFNLVRNAIQAIGTREDCRIRISNRQIDGEVEIVVEDSGPGLDQVHQEQLILPFASNKPGGLGLGLMISRAIVEAHGGRLWADRSDLGGAAFHFTLPRLKAASEGTQ